MFIHLLLRCHTFERIELAIIFDNLEFQNNIFGHSYEGLIHKESVVGLTFPIEKDHLFQSYGIKRLRRGGWEKFEFFFGF